VRALLSARGLRPKKRYGQNFLVDSEIARRIAQLALEGVPQSGAPFAFLEIGAGTGELTKALIDAGAQNLTAIEIDPDLVAVLRERDDLGDANIVQADALTFDTDALASGGNWRAVGNLPYNVATPVILNLAESANGPDVAVVMVQRDVAERIIAKPATRAYGSLSIAVQYAMGVERAFNLKPRSFYPPPKVDSTVIVLTRRERPPVALRDLQLFQQVVRAAFAYRRKTLANSVALALGFDRALVARALRASDLEPEIRGEQLDLAAFARLADNLAEFRI
jgi:16S rRNA (adenine1518-N6/adenine1519-N6)-dimethyltransferase